MYQYQLFQSIISFKCQKNQRGLLGILPKTAKKVDGNMGSKKARCITIPDKNFNLLQYRAADRFGKMQNEKCIYV